MPRRRCVGCGRIAPKSELLRLVASEPSSADDGAAVRRRAIVDPHAIMPGRGAYLCRGADAQLPAADCLLEAMRRSGIARALRSAVTVDPKLVESVS